MSRHRHIKVKKIVQGYTILREHEKNFFLFSGYFNFGLKGGKISILTAFFLVFFSKLPIAGNNDYTAN